MPLIPDIISDLILPPFPNTKNVSHIASVSITHDTPITDSLNANHSNVSSSPSFLGLIKRNGPTILSPIEGFEKIQTIKQIFWFSFMSIWIIFFISTTILYFKLLRNTAEFKFKSKAMTLVVSLNGLIYTTHLMVEEALVTKYPCFLRIWFGYCFIFIYAFSLLIRGISYISHISTIRYKNELSVLLSQNSRGINESQLTHATSFKNKPVFYKYIRLISNSNIAGYFSTYTAYSLSPISYTCPAGISAPTILIYIVLYALCAAFIPIITLSSGSKDAYGIRNELISTMTISTFGILALTLYNQLVPLKYLVYATGFIFTLPIFFLQHIFIIVMPVVNFMINKKHTVGKADLNSTNSTKKEQFESLLSYPAGFSRLNQAALETFCPENVEFLKDYQLLKYCVCSYIFRESADAIKYKDSEATETKSIGKNSVYRMDVSLPHLDKIKQLQGSSSSTDEDIEINYKTYQSSLYVDAIGGTDDFDVEFDIQMEHLIGGDIIPPLPITISDSVYTLGLMLDLNLINQSENKRDKNIPKFTLIPNKLIGEFIKFYLKYLEQDTLLAVNVPVKILAPIQATIRNRRFTLGMFDEALQEVLSILYTNTYPVMLKTL
ncbi:hypothetical protein BB561_005827 [Smittium simulii]|uniref:RGS domain-containing protein n=1 Tax=Smittium simulii TaxID=133385 RepID=A0A2T9Y814_9FUNG|nr:hypothetical protein BB561_005827 [Smittium simulii]